MFKIIRTWFNSEVARFKKHPVLWTALAVSATVLYFVDCGVADRVSEIIDNRNPNK